MDDVTERLILSQSQVIATLSLRISVLEKLLLEKKILSEAEVLKTTEVFGKEFIEKTQKAFQKAVDSKKSNIR
jgi:hypothetical protein